MNKLYCGSKRSCTRCTRLGQALRAEDFRASLSARVYFGSIVDLDVVVKGLVFGATNQMVSTEVSQS